jgi:putative hydrolase of the HAD superfamily
MPEFKNIIFDLGGVLLDLDFMAPINAFQQLGATGSFTEFRKTLKDPVFRMMETGEISPEEFRNQIRLKLGYPPVTDEQIDQAWCSILGSVPGEKVNFLKQMQGMYPLFLYSNTNQIHIDYFLQRFYDEHQFRFEVFFEQLFYSHVIHDRKPQLSGYEKVIALSGVNPEETLFVDDFEENVEAARRAGFLTFHYLPGTDLSLILNH